jgi:ectoine hydroxylase-related dioxygenase (phytanoyl-CoA dioxygenase family)|tara:strand:+ start:415 stop:1245 length:831 start_codon:yes stop_codon:yes gene_type:complete
MKKPTELESYLFDLNGYIVVKNALNKFEINACNKIIDKLKNLKHREWSGYVHGHNYGGKEGLNLQQIYEAGKPFEKLIDHPSWIHHMLEFVGGEDTFDHNHGPLFIDENFANVRGPGDAIGIHSGNHEGTQRGHYRYENGKFHCGQINILLALNDIGPGDGGTVVIPSSHKANFKHPEFDKNRMLKGKLSHAQSMTASKEIYLKAGDGLLFVDSLCHGSTKRVNKGERRIVVYRYGPSWGFFRHPYRPSKKLLKNLSKFQRQIVMPHEKILTPNEV